ncbi:serine/threonine-protein kinase VRK1-like [Aphidius gifuensis]|uniref:serine/threonine-protein kinase VRK1-like n=1 Tax=Aphidius gifuensis TaxID=684658 RepID=UPI001CDC6B19|nr:serine/threonine-protein kinase VRK1-like [Aphidius gifuensis]
MAAKGGKKGPGKKGANGYKMPDPINAGEVLTDMAKKQWIIGKSIGVGGFGEIYSAAPYSGKLPKEYPAVIKIEPHGNGPLFVEMHFYMRNCKPDDIETWRKEKKLSGLGMPKFNGSGSHDYKGTKYRFVVMDRYGTDLWKLFLENNRKFSEHTVYKIAIQIIDVLEYIHNRTYIHADIKGANLLLDIKNSNQVYLVDFGLASHYTTKTDYKLDPKKAHNGTIEYTSRDAHFGIPTMRSDFEILAYNIIQWLAGSLPWEKNLKDPSSVQKLKEKAFDNLKIFLKECFGDDDVPSTIIKYMDLLAQLEFNDTPDYDQFRDILVSGIKKLGYKVDGPLIFNDGGSKNNVTTQPDVTLKKTKKTAGTSSRRKSPRARLDTSPSTPLSPPPAPLLSSRRPKLPTTPSSSSSSSSLRRPRVPVTPSSPPPPPSSSTTTTPSTRRPRIPITPTTPASTRRPKVPSTPSSPPVSSLLDDSCAGIVVDKKREKLKDMRKILESIDDDSDTEFDIVITKKKNKIPKLDKKTPEVVARKQTVRKVRQKVVKNNSDADDDDDFEPEVILPKATRTRKVAVKKVTTRKKKPVEKNNSSDEDMFDE